MAKTLNYCAKCFQSLIVDIRTMSIDLALLYLLVTLNMFIARSSSIFVANFELVNCLLGYNLEILSHSVYKFNE